VFSIKAWTISQRFLHTGDSAHSDLNQPVQTYLSCNHAAFPAARGCPAPGALRRSALQEEAEHRASSQTPLPSTHLSEGELMPLEIMSLYLLS